VVTLVLSLAIIALKIRYGDPQTRNKGDA